ncbi:MAG: hypothetical protein PHC69_01760 [Ruminiclostridium sp.]|nr:hypothetical protein [Ruminiclostridium sp.]MDD4644257.1 hypothetical protein [Bacilli bacterium]
MIDSTLEEPEQPKRSRREYHGFSILLFWWGAALLAAPEPTGLTKAGGVAAIITGVATIGSGVVAIAINV